MSDPSVDQVLRHLLKLSGCANVEDLLRFAATFSVVPGATGNTKHDVDVAMRSIRHGEVPVILQTWYSLVAPDEHQDAHTLAAAE